MSRDEVEEEDDDDDEIEVFDTNPSQPSEDVTESGGSSRKKSVVTKQTLRIRWAEKLLALNLSVSAQ